MSLQEALEPTHRRISPVAAGGWGSPVTRFWETFSDVLPLSCGEVSYFGKQYMTCILHAKYMILSIFIYSCSKQLC